MRGEIMSARTDEILNRLFVRRRRGFLRAVVLLVASALVAALISMFGLARQYGYLKASLLSGPSTGAYYALATRLAERAMSDQGKLTAITTSGSIENVDRLVQGEASCDVKFALIQDGTSMPAGMGLELLGRLPGPEMLVLLARRDNNLKTFEDLRNKSIGIGPDGSGTAFLMRQLFADSDLADLKIDLLARDLEEQARSVSEGQLDLAAYVIRSDAEFLRTIIRKYNLDIVELRDLPGLVDRYRWLTLGRIPAGRFRLVPPIPEVDRLAPQVNTLIIASPCAKRADRIAFLSLLSAEIPEFIRSNPPAWTSSAALVPLAPEARQFFATGEMQIADRYFPWAVNLMSPVYWVYLLMAATALFNGLRGLSRFRLWRIDTARERLEAEVQRLFSQPEPGSSRQLAGQSRLADVQADILLRLTELRERCQRQVASFATPMGDEMFYRYQQSLIDRAIAALRPQGPSASHLQK
jgi:TRAP-type uncharacterized transport system substrate-binding protein